MTLIPPTSPGLIWITLSDGNEVLGYWREAAGFRVIHSDASPICPTGWCLDCDEPPHDVVAWRPLVPDGDVSWELQYIHLGRWYWSNCSPSDSLAEAEQYHDGHPGYRIVRVTRVVVEPEGGPAK